MTVVFDHRDPGTPSAAWDGLLTSLPPLELPGPGEHLLVLVAHPDDETLGAGGLIAAAARRDCSVTVVVATDGAASHPDSPTHTAGALARIRQGELRAAVAALAPSAELVTLDLPDGDLADRAEELRARVRPYAATCTHIVTTWLGDGHADHEACARVARSIAAEREVPLWQFPIWAWHWDDPGRSELWRHELRALPFDDETRTAKLRALSCYPSQHEPLSPAAGDEPVLSAGLLRHFARPLEVFVVADAARDTAPDYFAGLYRDAADPWQLGTRFYEQRKRAALLAALPRQRFRRAFEPGCATGELTEALAARCDEVVAWDVAESAVTQTAARLRGLTCVQVETGAIPSGWPTGEFDLVVLSEVGYYCADLATLARRAHESLSADGALVACHWRPDVPAHVHSAEAVHDALAVGLLPVVAHIEADFLLHVWTRSGQSVASAEGLA